MSTSRAMQSLAIAPSGAPLSKEQKSFNQLLNKIETQRKLLQEWEDATVSFRQKYATELKPLAGRVLLPKPAYERFMAQRANV